MKIAAVALAALAACSIAADAGAYDPGDFSAAGRMFEPAPEGHVPGKDNGPGAGLHHAGEDCAKCHAMEGKAERLVWTASGTLYADRSGSAPLKGGEIILEDRDGRVISLTTNDAGNFWTLAPIASNPFAVSAHGATMDILYVLDAQGNLVRPADPEDPRTWLYKAWVKKGAAVRPMLTIAPAAGSSGMPMSCSMHHAPAGSRGALWVSDDPALPAYPASGLSYRRDVFPILRSKCTPCHIPGATVTRLVTRSDIETPSTSFDFSGRLDLTSYAGSTAGGAAKRGVLAVVDAADPAGSPLLRKPLAGARHAGGAFWKADSPDYRAIERWIVEGAAEN